MNPPKPTYLLLAILLAVSAIGGLSIAADTNTYVFVPDQSTVVQTGGFAGVHETYEITGELQLTVDFDAGSAVFEWVDATLSEGPYLHTTSLDELFDMTKLAAKVVDSTTLQFFGREGLDLTVKLQSNSIRLTGTRIEPFVADAFEYELDAVATKRPVGWIYHYFDDFSTDKAKTDSYSHSTFWPENAFGPTEPYLLYTALAGNPAPGLAFVGYRGDPAHLTYSFPLGSAHVLRAVEGTLEFDYCSPPLLAMPELYGYLSYSLSPDGEVWTIPIPAEPGHNRIDIGSDHGTCYVSFKGFHAVLDNLKVHLTGLRRTILRVPQDYQTIQAAINAARDGDVVEVTPLTTGAYSGPGNWDIDFLGKAITVKGLGPEGVTIDCSDPSDVVGAQHRGFYFHRGETHRSVLEGFTIRGGRIHGDMPDENQPWQRSGEHPIGGGIYCEMSSPRIIDCAIVNCAAEVGGGIGCVAAAPVIIDCRIAENKAGGLGSGRSGGKGGGIGLIRRSDAQVINCVIQGNSGWYNSRGGGIYARSSSVRIIGCDISSNTAEGNIIGGGVYCGGGPADVVMHNNIISNNVASDGAGIYLGQGLWSVQESAANEPGGPVDLSGGVTIKNCTIAHNRIAPDIDPDPAGGIYADSVNIAVKNCIVWHNEGLELRLINPATNSPVTYSNIEDAYPGPGNIAEYPLFAPTGVLDYHLQSVAGRYHPGTDQWFVDNVHSPSIDAGDPDNGFGREPEPNGGRINMGAYGNTEQASKGKGGMIYHVDVNGSDDNDGLTRQTAFGHIQKGIETAGGGDTILVWPGIYTEAINYSGKAVTVQSAADAAIIQAPEYMGEKLDAVTFHTGEGPLSVLRNFVIRNSSLAVSLNYQSSPTITQLTIVDNNFGIAAYNVTVPEDPRPDISNCIFHNNRDGDLFPSDLKVRHSIFTRMIMAPYVPLFADYQNGDYHLLSRRGRYRATTDEWVLDKIDSIALDAGDPRIKPVGEPMPNGGRLNAGAYGGTAFASMSAWPLRNDTNYDGIINLSDVAFMARRWLENLPWVNRTPHVRIVEPYDKGKIPYAQQTITIVAFAGDPDGEVVKVEFFANNVKIGEDEDSADGWSLPWSYHSAGGYYLTATATDDSGATTRSRPIHISIVNGGQI